MGCGASAPDDPVAPTFANEAAPATPKTPTVAPDLVPDTPAPKAPRVSEEPSVVPEARTGHEFAAKNASEVHRPLQPGHFYNSLARICAKAASGASCFFRAGGADHQLTLLEKNEQATQIFLTHDWGVDELGRSTHARVAHVNTRLKELGVSAWFDEEEMKADINAKVISARDCFGCHCFLQCVTAFCSVKAPNKIPSCPSPLRPDSILILRIFFELGLFSCTSR